MQIEGIPLDTSLRTRANIASAWNFYAQSTSSVRAVEKVQDEPSNNNQSTPNSYYSQEDQQTTSSTLNSAEGFELQYQRDIAEAVLAMALQVVEFIPASPYAKFTTPKRHLMLWESLLLDVQA